MLQAFLVDIVHNRLREGNTADIALLPLFPPYGRICGRVIVADRVAAVVQVELDQLIDYVSHHAQHNDLQLMTDIEGTEYIAKVIGVRAAWNMAGKTLSKAEQCCVFLFTVGFRPFFFEEGEVKLQIAQQRDVTDQQGTVQKIGADLPIQRFRCGDDLLLQKFPARLGCYLFKEELKSRCAPATVNASLAALNGFFRFIGRDDCRLKFLKVQRRVFRDQSRELSQQKFRRLVESAAAHGKTRLALLLETIGGTGIRVGEVRYITVEAAQTGKAEITLKGKIRTILLPSKLCRKLLKYAKKQGISSGVIFRTRTGRLLTRRQIWAEMKSICKAAGVDGSKVFPHNLRHMFAVAFYRACRDVVKLADVLGHSSIDTTRIYLMTSEKEHQRQLDRLRLVL